MSTTKNIRLLTINFDFPLKFNIGEGNHPRFTDVYFSGKRQTEKPFFPRPSTGRPRFSKPDFYSVFLRDVTYPVSIADC